MLAFHVVHKVLCGLAIALIVAGGAPCAAAAGKVTLSLQLDTAEAARGGETGMDVIAVIERGWHINGHRPTDAFLIPTDVQFTLPPGISTDTLNYPTPDRKTFAFAPGKELLVYEGKVGMTTAVTVPADFAGTRIRIAAVMRYQACNDSTCLPPATAAAEVLVPVSATAITPTPAAAAPGGAAGQRGGGLDIAGWTARWGLGVTLLLVALLGLGLNLTPCVYPLIAVTVAYFGTQGGQRSVRVAALALLYVVGITASFASVGVAAALSGGVFGAALQKPAVLIFIATVLTALALSSFGLYQLQPPAALMRRVSGAAPGAFGAFFMGLTMGIVAAPCVGPVVLGLLVYVGAQQRAVLGFELFAALGLGMGVPYLVLAMAAGSIKALPRSGEWLVWVERVFGVLLLAIAAYFIAPLLPRTAGRLLLPVLIGVGGIYLGFIDRSGRGMRSFRSIQRVTGIVAVVFAVWAAMPQRAESAIRWQPFDVPALESARQAGRPAIIDFVADWCIPCHEMEHSTFTDPAVQQEAERFAMLRADITRENDATSALTDRYSVQGVPTLILLNSAGTEVQRLVGYIPPDELLSTMRAVR
jgi:thioredoxin:protein disulfide reductase